MSRWYSLSEAAGSADFPQGPGSAQLIGWFPCEMCCVEGAMPFPPEQEPTGKLLALHCSISACSALHPAEPCGVLPGCPGTSCLTLHAALPCPPSSGAQHTFSSNRALLLPGSLPGLQHPGLVWGLTGCVYSACGSQPPSSLSQQTG